MQLRDLFHKKGKKLFNRTVHSLKHLLLFDGHHKFPKPSSSFRPFSCASCREYGKGWKLPSLREESYRGFSGKWPGKEEANGIGGADDDDETIGSIGIEKEVSVPKEEEEGEKGNVGDSRHVPSMRGGGGGGGGGREGGYVLAKKMKELEMMEVGDMEHVLDIEEALHYYSRLTSPVYVGIVDQFFMDMYSDFTRSPVRRAPRLTGKKPGNRRTTGWSMR